MTRTMATSTKVSLCFVVLVITSVKGGRLNQPSVVGDYQTLSGTSVEFKCFQFGSANITFQWFKNDKPIPHQNNHTLPIHNVSSEDEGDYSCRTVVSGTGEMSPTSGKHSFLVTDKQGSRGRLTKPSFVGDNHALPGTTVEFKCLQLGSANITYQWFKNDKPIPHQKKRTLPIHNVSSEDEGDYSCRTVVSKTGEMSPTSGKHSFFMAVPPEVEIEQAKSGGVLQLVEGSGVNLTCNLLNSPKPPHTRGSYWWTFLPIRGGNLTRMSREEDSWIDRQRTSGQEVTLTSLRGTRGTQLILSSLHRTQSGRYTCHAGKSVKAWQNTASGTASIYIQIQYLDQPVVISLSTTMTVVAGDKVSLTCQVDSVPTANLTWLQGDHILRTVESNKDDFSFTARSSEDSGEYQCRAHNEALNKTVSNRTQIVVEYAPTPEGSGELPKVTRVSGREGENLTLSVKASGNPPPVYTWSDPELSIGQGSSNLTLQHLQPFHAGIYTVNVSNVHGSFLHTFHLTVQPASASAVADGDVSAVWLTVAGAVIFLLVALSIFLFVLHWCRTRAAKSERQTHVKWRCCGRGQQNNSSHNNDEHPYMVLYARDYYDSGGRRRQSQEVADYFSGESSEPYWSIDSADLSWLPQLDPLQHPPIQDSGGLNYDIPPHPGGLPLPRPHVFPHENPYPASDVSTTSDVTTSIYSDSVNEFTEGFPIGETSSTPQDSVLHCLEEDQDPEDSPSYIEWNVLGSLKARSLYEEEDKGSEDSISYFKWNMAGSQGAKSLCGEKDELCEDSEAYCEWDVVGSRGAGPLCGEEDQLCEDSEAYCEWEEVNQGKKSRDLTSQISDIEEDQVTPVYMDICGGRKK